MSATIDANGARARAAHWRSLASRAFRGDSGDPTAGPVLDAIVLLAVPMVLEMVMESVFAVVDIFFVARLGAEAVAGVALTEAVLTIVYTLAMGLSIGVTAMVARRVGERDPAAAAAATGQAIIVGAVAALAIGVLGVLAVDEILALLGGSPEVVRAGRGYAAVMLGGNIVILLLFLLNAAFRGAGDAAIAMRVLWLANGLNIVLDPLLIFGIGPFPELGVMGAAVATTIGRGVAVGVQLWTLFRLSGRIRLALHHLRPRAAVMARMVRLSATGTFQVFIGTASWIGLVRIVAEFGAEALAGYTIAIRLVLFALLPAWGLANAAATMVGQGLGAEDPDRAEKAVWIAGTLNLGLLGGFGVLFLVAAPAIVAPFGGDPLTSEYAVRCLRIVSTGSLFFAYGMVLTQSFNGAGDTWTPTVLNLFAFWLMELPLAWLLARPLGWGPDGAFAAITLAYAALTVASAVLFRRGRWRLITV